jgi:hypothetical protein
MQGGKKCMHWKEKLGTGGLAKIDVDILDCIVSFTKGLIKGLGKIEDLWKKDGQVG